MRDEPRRVQDDRCPVWCRGHVFDDETGDALDDCIDPVDGSLSRWHEGPQFGEHVSCAGFEQHEHREIYVTVEAELVGLEAVGDLLIDVDGARRWVGLEEVRAWAAGVRS